MTSTATQRLRLERQGTGDNPNDWGNRANNVFDLIDEAVGGYAAIVVAANVTLTTANYLSDQARRAVLRFTGAGGFTVTFPAVEKLYYIDNRCTADVLVKTPTGTNATVLAGSRRMVYCDGTNMVTDTTVLNSATTTAFNPAGNIAATSVQDAIVELDTEKVAKTGDAMTGDLSLTKANPGFYLNKVATTGQGNNLVGSTNTLSRWTVVLGDAIAESATATGSNFQIGRYNNAGSYLDSPIQIDRVAGNVTLPNQLNVVGALATRSRPVYGGAVFSGSANGIPVLTTETILVDITAVSTGVNGLLIGSGRFFNGSAAAVDITTYVRIYDRDNADSLVSVVTRPVSVPANTGAMTFSLSFVSALVLGKTYLFRVSATKGYENGTLGAYETRLDVLVC